MHESGENRRCSLSVGSIRGSVNQYSGGGGGGGGDDKGVL